MVNSRHYVLCDYNMHVGRMLMMAGNKNILIKKLSCARNLQIQIHEPAQHLLYRVCKYEMKEKMFLMSVG